MRRAVMRRVLEVSGLGVLALALSSCAPRVSTANEPLVFEEDGRFDNRRPVIDEVEIPRSRTGSIARAKFDATLDAGAGAFLGSLDVVAHVVDGRFEGWEIEAFDNPWVDLVSGDVVQKVNGRHIETPGQVHSLWLALRGTDEILVSVIRGEAAFNLRFTVQGAAASEGS